MQVVSELSGCCPWVISSYFRSSGCRAGVCGNIFWLSGPCVGSIPTLGLLFVRRFGLSSTSVVTIVSGRVISIQRLGLSAAVRFGAYRNSRVVPDSGIWVDAKYRKRLCFLGPEANTETTRPVQGDGLLQCRTYAPVVMCGCDTIHHRVDRVDKVLRPGVFFAFFRDHGLDCSISSDLS